MQNLIQTKKIGLIALLALVCLSCLILWIYNQFSISTDNAYINADVVQIAPRVTGEVNALFVANNQFVKQGQVLFELDPIPYQTALEQAKAKLAMSQANLVLAKNTFARVSELVKKRAESAQEGDNAAANLQAALAQMSFDQASLRMKELDLHYTVLTAPVTGWITNFTLRQGDIVTINQPVCALISHEEFWIDANFKETELKYVRIGQLADIRVDMYPRHHFQGKVQSISGGSGNAFSLLPPENATGNWVKVTQRVPVRIKVLNPDSRAPLRIGTSATVSLSVKPW